MTLKDFKRLSPGFLFFKKDKQWKDCDVYEVYRESEYKYLKEAGFVVFSLQSEAGSLLDEISDEMVMTNRRLLCEKYSDHTIKNRVFTINKQIEDDLNN